MVNPHIHKVLLSPSFSWWIPASPFISLYLILSRDLRTRNDIVTFYLSMPWSRVNSKYSIHWVQHVPSTACTEYSLLRVKHAPSTACTDYSIHWVQYTPYTAYTEYEIHRAQHPPSPAYTQYGLHQIQHAPNTAYTEYGIHRAQHTPSTAYTKYRIQRVQYTQCTASTKYSIHRVQHTLSTAHNEYCIHWVLHHLKIDYLPASLSSSGWRCLQISKFSQFWVKQWIESQLPLRLPCNLSPPDWPPQSTCSITINHGLQEHLQMRSTAAPNFAFSSPLTAYLQTHAIVAC